METYTESELELYKRVQKLAYDSVLEVKSRLSSGITEREAADLLDEVLQKKGVRNFFHTSFAWFGDRTSFTGFKNYFDFQPTRRKLEKGMCVILDTAPTLEGRACDIGYAFAFGENSNVVQAIDDLEIFRKLILERVLSEKTLSEIYIETDRLITEMGYKNCHRMYPAEVLGHKIGRLPFLQIPPFKILGFHAQTFMYLLGETVEAMMPKFGFDNNTAVPYWNETTNHRAEAGLWAVEPHIGKGDIGVKWEEILVVTESTAYWLDNDLPHVNGWREKRKERTAK
jgi:Xaa-Pro aminopeptidase